MRKKTRMDFLIEKCPAVNVEDWENITLDLGIATGLLMREGNKSFAFRLMDIHNKLQSPADGTKEAA